ncbi:MAG: YggT family protein [Patescibacteria group bacterium]|nr:YggT family protein [Patescibacteria group bacterium]
MFFVARIIKLIVGIIEFMLGVRVVLELFGASTAAPFVAWVYSVTWGLIGPFAGTFPNLSLGGVSVIDVVAVLAMIVYAVIGWLIIQIVSYIFAGV